MQTFEAAPTIKNAQHIIFWYVCNNACGCKLQDMVHEVCFVSSANMHLIVEKMGDKSTTHIGRVRGEDVINTCCNEKALVEALGIHLDLLPRSSFGMDILVQNFHLIPV